MKTIFITSFHVFVSRNILTAPIFNLLKQGGWRIILIVPEKKRDFFEKEFGGENIFIEGVRSPLRRLDSFFKDFALASIRTKSLAIMRTRNLGFERPFSQKIFFWAPLFRNWIPWLYNFLIPSKTFSYLFEKYKPAIVFSADVFSSIDSRLMHEAKGRGISIIGMVRSWDNLTTKGGFRVIPDLLVVNNDIVLSEAINIHGIPKEKIRVVGVPHYDRYDKKPSRPREDFYSLLGLDPDKGFVVYAPLGDRIIKVGDQIIKHTFDRDVINLISGVLPSTHQLLVRLPPTDTVNLEGFTYLKNVIFDRPGNAGSDIKTIRSTELRLKDDAHLVDTLLYSDVIITVISTISVDAAVLNKPIIIIGFDPKPVSYIESVSRLQEFDHLQPVLKSGGVKIAVNPDQLREYLNQYIKDPTIDEAGRKKIVQEQCGLLDGKSSQRLLAAINEL